MKSTTNFRALMQSAVAVLVATFAFVACQDYDNGFDEVTISYNKNFIDRYGAIDPNHNWGFEEIGSVNTPPMNTMTTRGIVRVNNNEWIKRNDNKEWEPNPEKFLTGFDIPGMPFDPDYPEVHYYIANDKKIQGYDKDIKPISKEEFDALEQDQTYYPAGIAGDVTEEEIAYVSAWFRTHKGAQSDKVRFSEFFVQHISIDKDREEYGTMENEGKPDWKESSLSKWQLKGDIESSTNPGQYPNNIQYNMDALKIVVEGKEEDEYISNFNGNENPISEDDAYAFRDNAQMQRLIQYWHTDKEGEYTTSFSYRNSNHSQRNETYLLKHLTFTLGNEETGYRNYNGFYLGFDYWGSTDDGGKKPDGYYSNWIVKLSPGYHDSYFDETEITNKRRVMCEDLGTTNDFDFNDLVFDVYYTANANATDENKYTAHITVQAAGGTMPIYIGSTENEAHGLLGHSKVTGGNYTAMIHPEVPAEITIQTATTNPDDIAILVGKNGSTEAAGKTVQLPSAVAGKFDPSHPAPQKICVPTEVAWTEEHEQIETKYEKFRDWVNNQENTDWWTNDSDWGEIEPQEAKLRKR